ncbi:RCC1 domain-containing protein [Bifidobacterium asteroides]|uniref:Uncharacterized protein n=1 Tax=Bifidobacterium asteroides TaxID=1684 RepID=A0ABS3IU72_9BIFI|nr:RCC1 domain-containing protein [Bifidobacterium asteroides]MCP8613661.1 RCC1 domain-containing protein [Bifidobacterium asteroides]
MFDGWLQSNIAYDFSRPVTRSITLTQGPAAGNTETTLTPPKPRGICFNRISLKDFHSAAIRSDSSLYAWVKNSSGQLGDGTNTDQNKPAKLNGFTWKQISLNNLF